MENVSAMISFELTAVSELQAHKYLYFFCFLFLYILIIVSNSVLIAVIYRERDLHEPMYFFICNLAVNGLYGSTSLLPALLSHLLSDNYEISLAHCLLQIYCLHVYATVEFTILAVMSYDRYVAICHPLHYYMLMAPKKLYVVNTLSWVLPLLYICFFIIYSAQLTFCGRVIENIYCSNFRLVKLSCSDTTIQSLVGLAGLFISPVSQVSMILFSYTQILRICLFASKESKRKAIQTCTPHLLTVINFTLGALFDGVQSRFNMSSVPYTARLFLALYYLIFPPMWNPVIYGMGMPAIRGHIFRLIGKSDK